MANKKKTLGIILGIIFLATGLFWIPWLSIPALRYYGINMISISIWMPLLVALGFVFPVVGIILIALGARRKKS